ncbi:2'-5' RNA ligase [Oceanobacillus picturae]|jgi:2'-5' RNA ligase|uniref:Putative phosphoesterase BN988_01109 n=1 Tax=Oceanobacillus picturae TaxID=171693 RepID=W9B7R5_9BACI|nr:YjcG family protein [Oceanobacillus picturae]GAQ16333.1 2'-5' RNA ligase [Oceanobacillus picturae]CDO02635.1 2'-5' RNA ligase [Oceanobacillus picturae]
MKYGIAIFPSKAVQDEANSYRKRYDPHYALIPPHITLKEAFEADEQTVHEFVTELKHIANDTEPFTVNIRKVSTFAPVTNTIYLKVEPKQELIDLFEKMNRGKLPGNQEFAFVPHITIAQKLSTEEYSDVYGSLKMKNFDLEDKVDRFQLLYQLDNGSWTVHDSFVFGKEKV